MKLHKIGATVRISREAIFRAKAVEDKRYEQKVRVAETPPTPEAWARYYRARAGLRALEAYEGTEWGGPDYGTEVREPEPTIEVEYLETLEDWLARCQIMWDTDGASWR